MTQILIVGSNVLASGPLTDTPFHVTSADAFYPKSVLGTYQILDIVLPPDFTLQGYIWTGTALAKRPIDPALLASLQFGALDKIDVAAGAKRAQYITTTQGQELCYTFKSLSAQAYKAAGYPLDATPYPWINEEAKATGATPQQVADAIIATAAAWALIGGKIEGARLAAKAAVKVAKTEADVNAAMAVHDKALQAI